MRSGRKSISISAISASLYSGPAWAGVVYPGHLEFKDGDCASAFVDLDLLLETGVGG